jgi:glycerol uptake facilitator protein
MKNLSPIAKRSIGEFIGCFALGYIGLGCIYTGIVYSFADIYGIGMMFGFTIMFAVIIAGPLSGAVLNPAITIAQAVFKKFPWKQVPVYIIFQVIGWFAGCLLLLLTVNDGLKLYEASTGWTRGTDMDVYTAQIFLCNMPNMLCALGLGGGVGTDVVTWPVWASIVNEIMASALLTISVLIFTDPKNRFRPALKSFPLWLGLIIALAIMFFLPGSTACMNPARDLGPRVALAIMGWGKSTFPGLGWNLGGYWWVWWVFPTAGAVLAGWLYEKVLCPCTLDDETKDCVNV